MNREIPGPGHITVFPARAVITMDPGRPRAEAIAVADGRIVSVGTVDSMRPWLDRYPHSFDESFAGHYILPGFIDPHTHFGYSGSLLSLNYVGPIASPGPDRLNPAMPDRAAVIASLRELDASEPDGNRPLFAWGFDPAIQGGQLHRDELDAISRTRPIWILSYAPHFVYANSAMLERLGADETLELHGLGRYPDGRLNGQFVEIAAIQFALAPFREEVMRPGNQHSALWMLGRTATGAGITTTADMAFGMNDFVKEWDLHQSVVRDPTYPLRMAMVPLESSVHSAHEDGVGFVRKLARSSDERLWVHGIKFINDGSYPAMSLRVGFPGYLDGGNGLRGDIPWSDLADRMRPYWDAGIQIHAHANGDETVGAVLDALADLQAHRPRFDHRFTVEHYCFSTPDQARRLKALGGKASVNNYFVHFRGMLHADAAFGPDRSEATARLGSLAREGVTFALHSDFSLVVVPLSPLTAVWTAVNRLGADMETVLASGECIDVDRALRAITIDAAHILRKDTELGSLEVGKWADFAVLDLDPYEIPPESIKDIGVWGTVLAGRKHAA